MDTVIARLNTAKAHAARLLNQLRMKTLTRTDVAKTSRMALLSADVVTQASRLRSRVNLPRWTALATLLLCGAYYVTAQIGLTLHFPLSLVYFVWPPSVVVFVALTLSPRRIWWVYALAVFPVHMIIEWTSVSAPLTSLALFYGVVWLQAVVGALCVIKFAHRPIQLNTLRSLIVFLFSGAVIAALTEALALATVLELTTSHPNYWLNFAQTYLADCLTMLVLAPALVSGYAFARQLWLASDEPVNSQRVLPRARRAVSDWVQSLSLARGLEAILLALGLLGSGFFAFGGDVSLPRTLPALLYLVLPLLLWAAVRFGLGGTSLSLCGLMLLSIMYAIQGRGPFSTLTNTEDLFSLQVFYIAISVPLLTLAVLVRERQQAQEELEQSEARYRAVVSNFPNGAVLLFDAQLRHIFADGQGVRSDGMFERSIVGSSIWDAFPASVAARLAPEYQAALAGTLSTFDLVADHRTYYVQTLPVHQNQVTVGMAVMQEVTEQRRAEALAELDQAKTAFFSNVSHEFRTPLTLMLGPVADALADREAPLPPRQRERLEMVQRSGHRLHKLVNALLDFSRIEAGRVQASYEPTDISIFTAELASTFRSAVERAGLRLHVECAPLTDLPSPVCVDRDMWEKIVLNLLSNALKFTFEGAITVTVRAVGEQNDHVELEIRDTGTGITEDELPHLFERFYSVQGARARTYEGAGIGLAMVQELVRLHGGTTRVTSVPGVGSVFTITIPTGSAHLPSERIARQPTSAEVDTSTSRTADTALFIEEAIRWLPEPSQIQLSRVAATAGTPPVDDHSHRFNGGAQLREPTPVTREHPDGAEQEGTGSGYILLADDDADMREYLTRLLSERWNVQVVSDGDAALAAARARPPDLILADVMMPGLDGFALLAALRNDPQTHALPIILLSARAEEDAAVQGLQAGAVDYLTKPFSARELLARIQARLELARARREAAARAAQLDAIIEAITDGVLIHDLDGNGVYANRAYQNLLQRQLEMQGSHVEVTSLLADPAERERAITISDEGGHVLPPEEWPIQRALRGETLTGESAVEEFFRSADGSELQVSVTAAPIRSADGKIIGAAAAFRDVTARRRLERQVAEQAYQLQAIFDAQADGIAVFDAQGRIVRINEALSQIYGLEADTQYKTRPLADRMQRMVLLDEQGNRLAEEDWPHARVLRGEILSGAGAMDYRVRTLDGRELWVSTSGAPARNATGQIVNIVLVTRDVTARRQLERQAQEQALQLETIFDTMIDGVFVLDVDGRVTHVNPAANVFLGREPSDGVIHITDERTHWLNLRDVSGEPLSVEQLPSTRLLRGDILTGANAMTLLLRDRTQQDRIISLTGGPLRDARGRIVGAVGVVRDVTELQRMQAALAGQERLFRTLVENSPDIIARFDRNLRHLYVSPAAEEVMGLAASTRLGKTYAEIGTPEAVYGQWEQYLRAAFATGQSQVFETDFRTTTGPRRVSQVRYIPERAADGSVESVLGITSDITQLKRTEEALRQSEERFSKAFHASPVAMAITSPTTSRILDANAAVAHLTGYRQDELIGRTASELGLIVLSESQSESQLDDLFAVSWTKGVRDMPVRVRMKSGEIRSCLVSTEGIWAGGEECTIVITYDVTAREQAEAALAGQERLFRTLVENSPDIIARFDRNLRYLYVNPAIAAVGALPAEAYIGKTNAELGWPESLYAPAHRAIEEVFRTGESRMLDESDPATPDTQDARVFRAQLLPEFGSDGTVESVLSVTTEITDLKRAEGALRAATATAEIAQRDEEKRRYEAERRERIAASLRDVLAILNSNQQVATILEYIARNAGDLLNSDAAAIYTTDTHGAQSMGSGTRVKPGAGASEALALQAAFGNPAIRPSTRDERRLAAGRAAIRKAMVARRPVAVFASPAASHDSRSVKQGRGVKYHAERPEQMADAPGAISDWIMIHDQALPAPYQALLAVPIVAQGQVYGGLLLLYAAPHSFSSDEVSLAMAYGDQVALAIANARLQGNLEWAATQSERTRLARELHDTVTQEIFTASMLAESIPLVWDQRPTEARAGLQQLHQLTRGALASLRALLLELRPAVLEQKSLPDLLRQLGEAMTTRAGVPIIVTIPDEHLQAPNSVKVAFYRIAQEALMNTVKYAHAHNISVRLRSPADGAIQLEIQDDGHGFDAADVPAGHFGVTMMRERARAVGATFRLTTRREQGTRVAVKWTENASAAPAHRKDAVTSRALRGASL